MMTLPWVTHGEWAELSSGKLSDGFVSTLLMAGDTVKEARFFFILFCFGFVDLFAFLILLSINFRLKAHTSSIPRGKTVFPKRKSVYLD